MLTEYFVLTLILLGVTAVLSWRLNDTPVGGATMFWASWALLFGAGVLTEAAGRMEPIPALSFDLVGRAYIGAFLGGSLGIYVARTKSVPARNEVAFTRLLDTCEWIISRLLPVVATAMFILGTIHFTEEWRSVEYDITRLLDVRVSVLARSWSWTARITSYCAMAMMVIVVLLGVADSGRRNIRLGRVVIAWLSTAPHGLAFGGRGWTLAPLIVYTFSLVLSRNCTQNPIPWRKILPIGGLWIVGLWLFTAFGILRQADAPEVSSALAVGDWGDDSRYMAPAWIAKSLVSVGVHSEFTSSMEPGYGLVTFDYFARKGLDLGLIREYPLLVWDEWRFSTLARETGVGFTWCVPPTAIPYLILDYGVSGMPIALGFLVGLAQFISVRWVGHGLVKHVAAFYAFYAMFNSIQTLVVVTSLTVVSIVAAFGIEVMYRLRGHRLRPFSSGRRPAPLAPRSTT